jgi:hypothetical protein
MQLFKFLHYKHILDFFLWLNLRLWFYFLRKWHVVFHSARGWFCFLNPNNIIIKPHISS